MHKDTFKRAERCRLAIFAFVDTNLDAKNIYIDEYIHNFRNASEPLLKKLDEDRRRFPLWDILTQCLAHVGWVREHDYDLLIGVSYRFMDDIRIKKMTREKYESEI